jgi:hypothetical protein
MALTLNRENPNAWFNKGFVSYVDRDYGEGLFCFLRAHRLGHPEASRMISRCHQKMGNSQSV